MNFSDDEINNYRSVSSIRVDNFNHLVNVFSIVDHQLRIIYLNIRSYNKNIESLIVYLESVKVRFDFIILGETWLGENDGALHIDGYNIFKTSKGRNRNDGVLVYVSERVSARVREEVLGDVHGLSLDFSYNNKRMNILAVYRTHGSDLDNFTAALGQYYHDMSRQNTYVLIGDVNANILATDNKTERYLDLLYELGFMCGVREATRVVGQSRSCIDHIFVHHHKYDCVRTAVVETDITDHYCIYVQFNFTNSGGVSHSDTRQQCQYIDQRLLSSLITDCDWTEVTNATQLQHMADAFHNNLQHCVNSAKKTRTVPPPRLKPIKPWITQGLVRSIRYRDSLSKALKRQPFNRNLKNQYNAYKNTLNRILKEEKKRYYRQKIESSEFNPKQFWKIINEMAGRNNKKDIFPLERFVADRVDHGSNDIRNQVANEFNDYFSQVGSNLAQAVDKSGPPVVNDSDYTFNATFTLDTITEMDLIRYVDSLRGGSAPGYDGISVSLLKDHLHTLKAPLLRICNESLRTGEFPDSFKIAKVIPLYKSNQITDKSNFRPISLLSVFTKVLEKIVHDQLTGYLERNDILVNNQYGFRKSKNIADALFNLNTDINKAITRSQKCLIIFMDLAKAFDTVDRHKLMNKLEHLGVRGNAYNWFRSYFQRRRQFVNINGISSDQKFVDYGVIQGSTLGPLLFLIYINNLANLRINGKLYLFADDSAVFLEGNNWRQVFENASSDVKNIKQWFNQNSLTLNVPKTKFLPISLRNSNEFADLSIKIHNCNIQYNANCNCDEIKGVSFYKYLGVIFDSQLTWERHIKYTNDKLRKMIYAFRQLGQVLNPKEIKMAYCAYVQSIIEGGIIAWGGAYKSKLQPLQTTQKAIMKAALNKSRRYPTEALFAEMHVLDVRQLYVRTILTYIHKHSQDIFENITHNYRTRNADNVGIRPPRITRTFSTTNSYVIANYLYKNIPPTLRQPHLYSLSQYKTLIKKWLFDIGRDNTEILITSSYRF